MQTEPTLEDVFEDIADRLALARSRALMGERANALVILQKAWLDYLNHQEVLAFHPCAHSLKHSFEVTKEALGEERARAEAEPDPIPVPQPRPARRKRARQAA